MPGVEFWRRSMERPIAGSNQAADPDPRAVLRLAQAAASGAAQAASDAAATAARAQVQVDRARAALAAFEGLDGRVAAHHAGILRAGAADRTALPAALTEARRDQAAARQDMADAVGAYALLAGEARELAATAERAEAALRAAVGAVAQEVAGDMVAELREVERQAGELRIAIGGYLNARAVSAAPEPWSIGQISHEPQHPHLCELASTGWPAASATWSAFRQRLAVDASATLAAPGAAP